MISLLRKIAIFLPLFIHACDDPGTPRINFNSDSPIINYGAARLTDHLKASGISNKSIFILSADHHPGHLPDHQPDHLPDHKPLMYFAEQIAEVDPEGYKILIHNDSIFVLGKTDLGCLYGVMDLMEQIGPTCDFDRLEERQVNPAFAFRAVKFNLPWAPYRPGPATDLHKETCRDLDFWEAFLDMMVENRFNALTLWSTHLFPFMIRAENYPEATPFDEQELHQWKAFWKTLFRMAKDRGIETYLVNWNIVVSKEFAMEYGATVHDDRSEIVKQYTRESVTQLINEYEDLTGLGVTLADWMGNWGENKMTPKEREDWIEATFMEGMNEADRKIKFIHRAVLAGHSKEMRSVIDHAELPEKTIVEVKFNWSHGHSTPYLSLTHSNDQGTIMRDFWDPEPENYFIAWMIRNEDFFVLRWGDPEFIRSHLLINHHDYVDGYFVGSEGYIPAKDYSHKDHPHKTWKYAFQKQWLFYHLWGRLTYNPSEKDSSFAMAIENRYPNIDGMELLKAYSIASRVPLYLASFYKSTWDFTLYSEGFLAPWTTGFDDGRSPFISIEELIRHETLDARYLGIEDYCKMKEEGSPIGDKLITPLMLARVLQDGCGEAMKLIRKLRNPGNEATLDSELDDLETWCHIGYYFAGKLRAGVALETYNLTGDQQEKETSIEHLEHCVTHWENVIRLTADRYSPMPYVSMGHDNQKWPEFRAFHWQNFREDVKADLDYVINMHH